MTFYAANPPSTVLILEDATTDPNKTKVNQNISAFLIIEIGPSQAQRIVLQTTGSYKFAANADTTCELVADQAKGIAAVSSTEYTCNFWTDLGPVKYDYLVFTWVNNIIPSATYKLKYSLDTPAQEGQHDLSVKTLYKYFPIVINQKDYENIYSADVDVWKTDYPKLYYSFNLNANDSNINKEIGLFSWTKGYHKIFNTLRFVFQASATINVLTAGETHTLEIYLGSTDS